MRFIIAILFVFAFFIMHPQIIEHYMFTLFGFDKFVFHDFIYVACMILNLIFFIFFIVYTIPFLIHHILINNFGYQYNYIYPFMTNLELYIYNIFLKIFIMLFRRFYNEDIDEILNSKTDSAKKQILLWDFFYFQVVCFILMYILILFILIKIFGIRNLSTIILKHILKYRLYYRIFIVVVIILLWTIVKY